MQDKNLARFLLTFFLGWLGSFIINHSSLKPERHTSRTAAYFFLPLFTFGIYGLVAAFCNLTFDPNKANNIGYICNGLLEPQPEPIPDAPTDFNTDPSDIQIVEDVYESDPVPSIPEAPEYDDSRTVDETQADEYN